MWAGQMASESAALMLYEPLEWGRTGPPNSLAAHVRTSPTKFSQIFGGVRNEAQSRNAQCQPRVRRIEVRPSLN